MRKKHSSDYDEIQHIKEDLTSLRSNVVTLTQHLTDDGRLRLDDVKGQLRGVMKSLKADGAKHYQTMEKSVKEHPGQAVTMAFAAGMLASFLLNRRG